MNSNEAMQEYRIEKWQLNNADFTKRSAMVIELHDENWAHFSYYCCF